MKNKKINSPEGDKKDKLKFDISTFCSVFTTEIGALVAVNICFLLACLPIFTIGTAMLSLQEITNRLYLQEKVHVFKEFFDIFKKNFKLGCKVTALLAVIFGVVIFASFYYLSQPAESVLRVFGGLAILAAVIFSGICDVLIQGLAYADLKISDMLKNACTLYFAHPLKGLISAVISFAFITLSVYLFPTTLPLTLFLFVSFTTLAKTCNTFPLIQFYVTKTI